MSALDLRADLLRKLEGVQDQGILQTIYSLLEDHFVSSEDEIKLTPDHKRFIDQRLDDLEKDHTPGKSWGQIEEKLNNWK